MGESHCGGEARVSRSRCQVRRPGRGGHVWGARCGRPGVRGQAGEVRYRKPGIGGQVGEARCGRPAVGGQAEEGRYRRPGVGG